MVSFYNKTMKKYIVYLLLSIKDNRTYLGSTDNLERRLKEHEYGECKSTKNCRPLKLIYTEEYATIEEARKRERYLKTRHGRRELKRIFENLNNKKSNNGPFKNDKLKRLK